MVVAKIEFSKNLRVLCAEAGSMAQVCRDIGINRQQFNKYVTGKSLPAAHNLHRIAAYFKIPEGNLFKDSLEFLNQRRANAEIEIPHALRPFAEIFRHQSAPLRRYLGFYHSHFISPAWPGQIFRSLVRLKDHDGFVASLSIERGKSPDRGIRQRVNYQGLVTLRGHRIYIIEVEKNLEGSVDQTVLFATHRDEIMYLQGQTSGVALKPRTQPYSSPVIWKHLTHKISAREAIKQCGVFPMNSLSIDPNVRRFLNDREDS